MFPCIVRENTHKQAHKDTERDSFCLTILLAQPTGLIVEWINKNCALSEESMKFLA